MVVSAGEGKYGWFPHLITGSHVCVPLTTNDMELESTKKPGVW